MRVMFFKNPNIFELQPENKDEEAALWGVQKKIAEGHTRMYYRGRSDGGDKHLRFYVGSPEVMVRKRGRLKKMKKRRVLEEDGVVMMRLRGKHADEVFNIIKYHAVCSSTIVVTASGKGLKCYASPREDVSTKALPSLLTKRRRS